MGAPITATQLRKNVYRILDEVLDSGKSMEVIRNGKKLLIVPEEPRRLQLRELPRRKIMNCTPDELVATSWDHSWDPDS
jgi:hypothetical protein